MMFVGRPLCVQIGRRAEWTGSCALPTRDQHLSTISRPTICSWSLPSPARQETAREIDLLHLASLSS
jgi:hypothetical protein